LTSGTRKYTDLLSAAPTPLKRLRYGELPQGPPTCHFWFKVDIRCSAGRRVSRGCESSKLRIPGCACNPLFKLANQGECQTASNL